jgi:hypothetical protein
VAPGVAFRRLDYQRGQHGRDKPGADRLVEHSPATQGSRVAFLRLGLERRSRYGRWCAVRSTVI